MGMSQGGFGTASTMTHMVAFEGITINRIEECTVDVEKAFSSASEDDLASEKSSRPAIPVAVSRSFGSISAIERHAIAPFSDSICTPPDADVDTDDQESSYLASGSSRRGS